GWSAKWITQHLKEQGFASASGKPWTPLMVEGLLHPIREKVQLLEDLHRRLIAEALARGLDYSEIARQFNRRKIRQRGRPPWTSRNVARRWNELNRPKRNRKHQHLPDTGRTDPTVI